MAQAIQANTRLESVLDDVLTTQGSLDCSGPVDIWPEPTGPRGRAVPALDPEQAASKKSRSKSGSAWRRILNRRRGSTEHSAEGDVPLDVSEVWTWATRRSLIRSNRMSSSSSLNSVSSPKPATIALRERIAAAEKENERLWEYVRELREANTSLWNVQELQAQAYDHELAGLRSRVMALSVKEL